MTCLPPNNSSFESVRGTVLAAGAVFRRWGSDTAQQKREELVSIQHGQNAVVAQPQDPRVLGAFVRTADERRPTIEDRGTAFSRVVQYLNHFWVVHELHRNGALDEEQYQLWAGFAVAIVAPKGVRRWWDEENGRLAFRAEVRELIDSRLRDPESPPVPITEMWTQFSGEAWEHARSDRVESRYRPIITA